MFAYLTKLVLDPRHPLVRRDLVNPYEMHRTLSRVYAPDSVTPPNRFLWRLEHKTDMQPFPVVLVQSEQPGNWSQLSVHPGYAVEIHADKLVNLDRLIQHGGKYRFRLLANPTITRAGKRWGLVREEDQLAWLKRQGEPKTDEQNEPGAFRVLGCICSATERLRARQGKSGNLMTVQAVQFDGLLECTNPERLQSMVVQGLGHAKCLGLGLLSLAKVSS